MRFLFSIIAITICAVSAEAQTFLGHLRQDEQGRGHVTVVQSTGIDSLVNGNMQQSNHAVQQGATQDQTHAQQGSPTKNNSQNASSANHTSTGANHNAGVDHEAAAGREHAASGERESAVEREHAASSNESEEAPVIDNHKKVMSHSYKTQGYRIQVFSGGNSRKDRQKAESAGAVMKSNFPSEPIYVHFYSPSWKCRMGNYTSIGDARRILAQVKKLGYTQACIVKGTISVQY